MVEVFEGITKIVAVIITAFQVQSLLCSYPFLKKLLRMVNSYGIEVFLKSKSVNSFKLLENKMGSDEAYQLFHQV